MRIRSLGRVAALAAAAALAVAVGGAGAAPGDLDPGFGSGGRAVIAFASPPSAATATALQPDGKIVLVGNAGRDVAVARLNPDGTLDTSFGNGGSVVTDV